MDQRYGKESTLGINKHNSIDMDTVVFNPLRDMLNQNAPHTQSYTDLLSAEHAYPERPGDGLQKKPLQHQEEKIRSMEERITYLEEQHKISNYFIAELIEQVRKISTPDHAHIDSLRQQNEISRKELISIFGIDPDDKIDAKELDGLLSNYADPEQDSRDLIRSIRGG